MALIISVFTALFFKFYKKLITKTPNSQHMPDCDVIGNETNK